MSQDNPVQAVIDGIQSGQILETFDRYYAPDVVMSENGADDRVGFEACRAYEEAFVNGVDFHDASVGRTIISGDQAAIEWTFDFTPKGGERVVQKQVALQAWRDGEPRRAGRPEERRPRPLPAQCEGRSDRRVPSPHPSMATNGSPYSRTRSAHPVGRTRVARFGSSRRTVGLSWMAKLST